MLTYAVPNEPTPSQVPAVASARRRAKTSQWLLDGRSNPALAGLTFDPKWVPVLQTLFVEMPNLAGPTDGATGKTVFESADAEATVVTVGGAQVLVQPTTLQPNEAGATATLMGTWGEKDTLVRFTLSANPVEWTAETQPPLPATEATVTAAWELLVQQTSPASAVRPSSVSPVATLGAVAQTVAVPATPVAASTMAWSRFDGGQVHVRCLGRPRFNTIEVLGPLGVTATDEGAVFEATTVWDVKDGNTSLSSAQWQLSAPLYLFNDAKQLLPLGSKLTLSAGDASLKASTSESADGDGRMDDHGDAAAVATDVRASTGVNTGAGGAGAGTSAVVSATAGGIRLAPRTFSTPSDLARAIDAASNGKPQTVWAFSSTGTEHTPAVLYGGESALNLLLGDSAASDAGTVAAALFTARTVRTLQLAVQAGGPDDTPVQLVGRVVLSDVTWGSVTRLSLPLDLDVVELRSHAVGPPTFTLQVSVIGVSEPVRLSYDKHEGGGFTLRMRPGGVASAGASAARTGGDGKAKSNGEVTGTGEGGGDSRVGPLAAAAAGALDAPLSLAAAVQLRDSLLRSVMRYTERVEFAISEVRLQFGKPAAKLTIIADNTVIPLLGHPNDRGPCIAVIGRVVVSCTAPPSLTPRFEDASFSGSVVLKLRPPGASFPDGGWVTRVDATFSKRSFMTITNVVVLGSNAAAAALDAGSANGGGGTDDSAGDEEAKGTEAGDDGAKDAADEDQFGLQQCMQSTMGPGSETSLHAGLWGGFNLDRAAVNIVSLPGPGSREFLWDFNVLISRPEVWQPVPQVGARSRRLGLAALSHVLCAHCADCCHRCPSAT